jgi:hypothetical protein
MSSLTITLFCISQNGYAQSNADPLHYCR